MLRFSDSTWRLIKRSGLKMVFFGAESGSDEVLKKMSKNLTTEQTLAAAAKTREHNIVPEFSFIFGDPDDPEREIDTSLAFVRRLKDINPAMELVPHFYTPTPQRRGTYGNVDPLSGTPGTLEEWIEPQWVGWMTHEDPDLSWLPEKLKNRVQDFCTVFASRFPSANDVVTRPWGSDLVVFWQSVDGKVGTTTIHGCCAPCVDWCACQNEIDGRMATCARRPRATIDPPPPDPGVDGARASTGQPTHPRGTMSVV